ncbi:MAG: DinB family protein [Pyrinomonadaceae bacterium]
MSAEKDEQWQEAIRQHLDAVRAFVDAASKLSPDTWLRPVGEGKWSPAEISEHLKLVYEGTLLGLRGGTGIEIRSNWLLQRFLRLAILPRILKTGKFPKGAKSPHEMRPTTIIEDQPKALAQFSSLAREFQSELVKRKGLLETRLTHHVFGYLNALEGLRLVTMHIVHHQRQLP